MNPKKAASSIIIISLVFAALIIASSYLLAGTGYEQTATFVLIAIWFVPFTYLSQASKA